MTDRKKNAKGRPQKWFALVTFDLLNARDLEVDYQAARAAVHKKMVDLDLVKELVKLDGNHNDGVPHNTFTGLFSKDRWSARDLKRHLAEGVKAAIDEQGIDGRVLVVITKPQYWMWGSIDQPRTEG
ncbi:hypothetical protein [Achromobacter insolitus]|uniref:hypothetical protein n=1 Tax=Achromobacter insolitus TaxID=217204 RepID=UPI0028AD5AC2|nr:hypothetical protein [Achromobacter insolitus]